MELWIRSQSKDSLVKVYDIQIDSITYEGRVFIINSRNSRDCVYLGEYKSKKRALEVLDEIHQRLIDIQSVKIMGEMTPGMKKRGIDCVYIMPQE